MPRIELHRTLTCPLTGSSGQDRRSGVVLACGGRTFLPVTSKAERQRSIQKWVLPLAVAIPVAAVIIYLLIWYGPDVLATHDVGNVTGPLQTLRLQQAQDAARGRLLTLGAGIFAAGALTFTARNSIFAQRTVQLTEQGQVTDRYTKAIDQLGSDKLDVRIGGIYALERVDAIRPGTTRPLWKSSPPSSGNTLASHGPFPSPTGHLCPSADSPVPTFKPPSRSSGAGTSDLTSSELI